MSTPNPFDQQRAIPGVKKIIAVASGKGGVGKSTVALNLAMALSKKFKVGLLDADIYGPSVPRLIGALHQKPGVTPEQKLLPIERYGIKAMSLGFLIEEGSAVVWRGPMLFKAMDQLLRDVVWGDLDYLIVDLPPGTGDVQLSLVQKVPIEGVVVVTTPQNLSLIDVKKAVDMFQRVNVKILGVVENMSYFWNAESGEKIQLFPKGELSSFIDAQRLKHLVEIPFHPHVGLSCEAGVPLVESTPHSLEAEAFMKLAEQVSSS